MSNCTSDYIKTTSLSFYNAGQMAKSHDSLSVSQVIEIIRSGSGMPKKFSTRMLCSELREIKDPVAARGWKAAKIPSVTWSGVFNNPRNGTSLKEFSNLMCIDIDNKTGLCPEALIARMRDDRYVYLLFHSPSGNGFKIVVKVSDFCCDWVIAYSELMEYFESEYEVSTTGFNIDNTKDVCRLCFLSYDPEIYVNNNAHDFEITCELQFNTNTSTEAVKEFTAGDIVNMESFIEHLTSNGISLCNNDYNRWIKIGFALSASFDDIRALHYWHKISEIAPSYDPIQLEKKFSHIISTQTVKRNITAGTLFYFAKESGFILRTKGKYLNDWDSKWYNGTELMKAYRKIAMNNFITCVQNDKLYVYSHTEGIWNKVSAGQVDYWTDMVNIIKKELSPSIKSMKEYLDINKENEELSPEDRDKYNLYVNNYELFTKFLKPFNSTGASLTTAINQLRSSIDIDYSDLDNGKHGIPLKNGVFNVTTNELLDNSPSFYFTKKLSFPYLPYDGSNIEHDFRNTEFYDFLFRVFDTNDDPFDTQLLVDYFIDYISLCLNSVTQYNQRWLYLQGTGGNGKTTLQLILKEFFGENILYKNIDSDLVSLDSKINKESHLAELKDVRLGIVEELELGKVLNENLLKQLTGGGEISARKLYEQPFNFVPELKLILIGNSLLDLKDATEGATRRIALIHMKQKFHGKPGQKTQEDIIEKVRSEFPLIFNLLLSRLKKIIEKGSLELPDRIKRNVTEYKQGEDRLAAFMSDNYEKTGDDEHKVYLKDMFNRYDHWCKDNGEAKIAQSSPKFGKRLAERDYELKNGTGNKRYISGIRETFLV